MLHSGCMNLAREIARARPRLVVFGHIHVGHGEEEMRSDRVRRPYEGVFGGWEGRRALVEMALCVLWTRIASVFFPASLRSRWTRLVNAAVVGGKDYEYQNLPMVVQL